MKTHAETKQCAIHGNYKYFCEHCDSEWNRAHQLDITLQTKFYLSQLERDKCDRYYILYWQPEYLFQSRSHLGFINRDDTEYKVIFLQSSLLKLLEDNTQPVRVSFRKQTGKQTGYALVRTIPTNSKL